jgi:hypothetical protein
MKEKKTELIDNWKFVEKRFDEIENKPDWSQKPQAKELRFENKKRKPTAMENWLGGSGDGK